MRILLQPPFGLRNAHAVQELQRMLRRLLPGHSRVNAQTLCQLSPDREHRIKGRHRFLEDDADLVAADCPHQGVVSLRDVDDSTIRAPIKQEFTARNLATPEFHQADERKRRHGLAGSGFTDDAEGLAGQNVETDILNAQNRAVPRLEFDTQLSQRGKRLI